MNRDRMNFSDEWPSVPEPLTGWNVSYVVVPPLQEPLTLDEVKLWHHIDHSVEDAIITRMIKSAREWVEGYLEQSIVQQTREVAVRFYYEGMAIPYGPVQEIVSVSEESPYLVRYVAGYPSFSEDPLGGIPEPIITAMQLLIGDLFENRANTLIGVSQSTLPLAVEAQLSWWRRRRSFA